MAINKKLIHFKKYETFNGSQGINGATEPINGMYGNIPEHSIVFILDVKKIWTHGQLYDCDLSALEELGLIKELIEEILNTLAADKFKEYDKEYLTFTALEDSTVGYEMPMWASDDELPVLDLLYSYDGITWTNFDGTTLSITAGNFVKFKGDNTEFHRNIGAFIINGKVDVSGNVMSIVYADNFIGKIDFPNDEFNLSNLFGYQCLGLYSAHNLILPTLNLTYLCYYDMFAECISLISTPELPATTLLEECYCGMFSGCTSLTIAPLLPSLELAPYCYSGMFYNCSSLVIAPELPATMLATSCYSGMFNKCSSLVNAPILPAIVLAYECYLEMFYDCVSLISTPELPATILADRCYNMMFYGCTSLTNICELPAKKLKNSCYQGMFGMCTSLTEIPELHAKTLVYNCYSGMFSGCDNVTYATLLCDMPETSDQDSACEGMFSAPSGTIVLSSTALSYPTIVPQGWKVVNYYVNNDYITKLNNRINSSDKNIQSNTTEIDILKNRIISTTYSELKDAVTNSTLTTGQYYRITDYVTTCNGTSAKVTDVSTIDPENPVDGQSRSAGHLFDIVVRALSPNQLDENAVAVRHEGDTYYPEDFDGTIIKYFIENKEFFSVEDGKGTIFYMKDHNNNECPYDFTNIQYYNTNENIETGWYYTFSTGVDSYYTRAHDNLITPTDFHILPNIILITPEITSMTIYDNHITLYSYNLLISGLAIMLNKISASQNVNFIASTPINSNKIHNLQDSNFISTSGIRFNVIHGSKNLNFHCKEIDFNTFDLLSREITVNNELGRCFINRFTKNSYNITADSLEGMTFNCAFNITLVAVNNLSPKYCNIGVNTGCMNVTLTGNIQGSNISGRYLEIVGNSTASINNNIHEVRGASASNPLSITLQSGNHKKDIYKDVSGRIFHVWEDNGVKKGYYINNNTDTEWKEYSEELKTINGNSIIGEGDITLVADSIETDSGLTIEEALANKANINGDYNEDFKANLLDATSLNVGSIRFEDSGEYPYIDFSGINYANGEIISFPEYNELMLSSTLATLNDIADKAETYTITDFTAYDIQLIKNGNYTLTINPILIKNAIDSNKIILIRFEEESPSFPISNFWYDENTDLMYLYVFIDDTNYTITLILEEEFVLTNLHIICSLDADDRISTNKLNINNTLTITKDENDNALMQISENLYFDNYVGWNSGDGVQHYINALGDAYLTDLRTNKLEIDNALTITKDSNDYAHLNISEGLILDNIVEWTDGSDTTASINYDGSASFTNLSVAGKDITSFLTHHNSDINVVASLSNVPTDKAIVFAYINLSQELTFDDTNLVSGRGVHVFIYNNSSTTPITIIPLLDGSTFLCDNVTEFEIPTQSIAEVSMVYLNSSLSGSLKFIRSITL